ncbi:uncharacterized protein, partial [Eurosta solidaginis]|uniref:uncharacterized protein n=1 Tax=Eurosta solidaginis TaxID=178769 RepID=UPI003530BC59
MECKRLVEDEGRNGRLVIGADANAHNNAWGGADTNKRGESLFCYILQTNLQIANRGNVPTYIGPTSSNVLDIKHIETKLGQPKEVANVKELEESNEFLTMTFMAAYNKACPLRRFREKAKPPWLSNELSLLRRQVKEMFKLAKTAESEACRDEYRDLLRIY